MSWSVGTNDKAVTVSSGGGAAGYEYDGTSMSTILLRNGGSRRLRMYGVRSARLERLDGVGTPFITTPNCTSTSPFVAPYVAADGTLDTQEYIESTSWTTRGGFAAIGSFLLDKTIDSVYKTCVPRGPESPATTWYRLQGVGSAGLREDVNAGELKVEYKDVHVLELPGGAGWLMVLARYLAPAEVSSMSPKNSVSQIVAWWSDTADFTGTEVVGPFLLVDSCRCLSEDQGVRLWIGVPASVVIDVEGAESLLVYYSVDECGVGHTPSTPTRPGRYKLYDTITRTAYNTELTRLGYAAGVLVKRFVLSDLLAQIWTERLRVSFATNKAAARDLTDETTWAPDSAISGDLLGSIRLWFPDPSNPARLRAFGGDYPLSDLRPGDPVPVTCGGTVATLSLFMSMIGGEASDLVPADASSLTLGSGHGIWRGRALDVNWYFDAVHGQLIHSTPGKDFLFETQSAGTLVSPDQVAEGGDYRFTWNYVDATTDPIMWIDPDPVQLDDGSWWVAVGAGDGHYMTAWKGTRSDGCATAASAISGKPTGSNRLFTGTRSLPPPAVFAEAKWSPGLASSAKHATQPQTTRLDTTTLTQGDSTPSSGAQPGLRAEAFIETLRSRAANLGQR